MSFFNKFPYTDFHELNLDWIINHFKEFIAAIDSLESWKEQHEQEYEELKNFMDQINAGVLPDAVYESIRRWCDENLYDLFGNMIKFITVSINDAGYIVLNFPEHWETIVFNTTGLDISTPLQPEYGHLTISY